MQAGFFIARIFMNFVNVTAQTSTTTGTVDYVVSGTAFNSQTFANALTNGSEYAYRAYFSDGVTSGWEVGRGNWTSGSSTLARTTIEDSSNAGSKVSWAAGEKLIEIVLTSYQLNQFFETDGLTEISAVKTGDRIPILDSGNSYAQHYALVSSTTSGYSGQNLQTGTTYTLALTDAGKLVEMNNASANTLTVPPNSSVAFPTNTRIDINQYGAGLTTVAQGSGVTIRGDLVSQGQYKGMSLWKRATNEWVLYGGTT